VLGGKFREDVMSEVCSTLGRAEKSVQKWT